MINLSKIIQKKDRKSFEVFLREKFDNDIDRFITELNTCVNDLLRTNLNTAGSFIEKLPNIFKILPPKYRAQLIAIEARYYQWKGDHKSALQKYKSALKYNQRFHNFGANAGLRKGMINVHLFLGNYPEAIKLGKTALRYFLRKKLHIDAAQVSSNIGNVYHRMDNNRMALIYYDRAREVYKKVGGVGLAIIEFNRANIYANLNKINKARTLYEKAAEIYKSQGMHIAEYQAIFSIAYLCFLDNKYTDALKVFENVYEKFISLGDERSAVIAHLDLAEINISLNQFGAALIIARDIIPRFKKFDMTYEEGKAHYFIFQSLYRSGEFKRAAAELACAKRLFVAEKNNLWLGMIHIARSKFKIAEKKYMPALRDAEKALAYFKKSGDKRRQNDAEIIRIEASLKVKTKEFSGIKKAKIIAKGKLLGYQKYNLFYLLGDYYFNNCKYETALIWLKRAIRETEKMLSGFYPDEIRFFFLADKFDCYKKLIECLIHLGNTKQAFLLNLKALEIAYAADGFELQAKKVPKKLIGQRESLRIALKKYYQVPRDEIRGHISTADVSSLEHKLWSTERKIRALIYPEGISERKGVCAQANITKSLEINEVLVSYLTLGSKVYVFYATKSKVSCKTLPCNAQELQSIIRKLNFICERAVFGLRDSQKTAQIIEFYLQYIYSHLIEPIEDEIKHKKLLIAAEGNFYQIPFIALKNPKGDYLKDYCKITIMANPRDIFDRSKTTPQFHKRSNSIFSVTSGSLPSIEVETKNISSYFKLANIYQDEDANCNNLTDELQQTNGFIHIAAHASRSSENPLFSKILLGDGPFFPFDLGKTGVKACLTTLSGCQTAAPGLYYGNSFSLAKAFSQAGSKYVLATLWPVSDKISMFFMKEFYGFLSENINIYESYLNAIAKLSDEVDNPAFWGSFVLLGI